MTKRNNHQSADSGPNLLTKVVDALLERLRNASVKAFCIGLVGLGLSFAGRPDFLDALLGAIACDWLRLKSMCGKEFERNMEFILGGGTAVLGIVLFFWHSFCTKRRNERIKLMEVATRVFVRFKTKQLPPSQEDMEVLEMAGLAVSYDNIVGDSSLDDDEVVSVLEREWYNKI